MTAKEITELNQRISSFLSHKRLGDAFRELHNTARANALWQISDRLQQAEQSYGFLLRYMVDGIDDPQRQRLHLSLLRQAHELLDQTLCQLSIPETPTIYYNTLRSVRSHQSDTITSLISAFTQSYAAISPFGTASSPESAQSLRIQCETLLRNLFNAIWTSFPLNAADASAIHNFLTHEAVPTHAKASVTSALTVALLQFYDDRAMRLLIDAHLSPLVTVTTRATVGLILVLDKYKLSTLHPDTIDALEAIKEQHNWLLDCHNAVTEIIRTTDTKRISDKLNSQIFPEIQKMSHHINERFKDTESLPDESNPEWDDIIGNSNIRNSLKELTDLQQEGADVFMATFSSLKQFPFFNEAANWFLPYDPSHSALSPSAAESQTLASMIAASPFICDSDKFSMALSMSLMPYAQRNAMASQLNRHKSEISEMLAHSHPSTQAPDRKAELNNYVHSLYRFFHLFRRKGDFYNPFAHVLNPIDIPVLASEFADNGTLSLLAHFYFKNRLYHFALKCFLALEESSEPSATRSQKIAFCYEKLNNLPAAAQFYEQTDLLEGSNRWTLKRLTHVLHQMGKTSSAIAVAKRLLALDPANSQAALTLAHLLIQNGNHTEAIPILQEQSFLNPSHLPTLRALSWALFLCRRYDEAQQVFDSILALSPSATDLLNIGHNAWAHGRLAEAVNYYRLSAEQSSTEVLIASIENDTPQLALAGIDTSQTPLLIDAILYSLNKQ